MCKDTLLDKKLLLKNTCWRADNPLAQYFLPAELKPWLCGKGSLTAALKSIADGTFRVELLSQQFAVPYWHEQKKLGRGLALAALIRHVNLHVHGEAVVFARSIIPLSLASRGGGGLATLGQTPLGHLLFKSGRMRVSRRDFAVLPTELCKESQQELSSVYARRTPYDYLGDTILVSEYFLPGLNKYL